MIRYLTIQLKVKEDGTMNAAAQVHKKEEEGQDLELVHEQAYGCIGTPCCWQHGFMGTAEFVTQDLAEYLR
jgi:hypothetical protein